MSELKSTPDAQYVPELPPAIWDAIATTVIDAVNRCDGVTPYPRRRLISTIAHHTAWCFEVGYSLEADELFSRELVDSSIVFGFKHLSPGSLSTIRAQLLRVGEIMAPTEAAHRLKALPSSGTSVPYTPAEVASLYGWATGQPSDRRRSSAKALITLGLGVGFSSGEILATRARNATLDKKGFQVTVERGRPRTVQMLGAWESTFAEALTGLSPDDYIFRPGQRGEHLNSITNFVARSRGIEIKPLGQRMRATWIVRHLQHGVPVAVLLAAAGVDSLEAFTRYVKFLEPVTPKARKLLR